MKIELDSEAMTRTESMAELADAYRVALALLKQYEWTDDNQPHPDDALRLATFLARGLESHESEAAADE